MEVMTPGEEGSRPAVQAPWPEVSPEVTPYDEIALALERGVAFLASLQGEDGSWRGDYGGPMFLLPMYLLTCYITEQEIPQERREAMLAYLRSAQKEEGCVGLHLDDKGAMFTTVLSYVALRLGGVGPEDPDVARMRHWIQENGTALGAATWGKLFLALLNLYPYEGLHPVLPELWLLPSAAPIHPGRLWCHCRQVYLPMAYLYGSKAQIKETPLLRELRQEIYDQPYEEIPFARHRDTVAPSDNRFPAGRFLQAANRVMDLFERWHPTGLRQQSLAELYRHIQYEDQTTDYLDIGPVNSLLNTLVHYFADPKSIDFQKSFSALEDYLCLVKEGIHFNGYNSTALWDTAFAVQAIMATPLREQHREVLQRASRYIRENQVLEDVPERERYFRHASRGGWPFSDRRHGWPITDCTAEGFKSALRLEEILESPVEEERLQESIRLLLSFQNRDGGWATYEKQRGGAWLEWLNPSQVFGGIMVDYSYVECTSACLQALACARRRFPGWLEADIVQAMERGLSFLRKKQRVDGSWEGSWAICFTYGTWFGVWGLLAAEVPPEDAAIQKACGFLLAQQNPDGGWGEHYLSCQQGRYLRDKSHPSQTAWALLALIRAGLTQSAAVKRGVRFLLQSQQKVGDWPTEPLVGIFNKSTAIGYENYRRYFPLWALAEFQAERRSSGVFVPQERHQRKGKAGQHRKS